MPGAVFCDRLLIGTALVCSLGVVWAIGAQPRGPAAIAALQKARMELAATSSGDGGHHARALALVDQALAEMRAGTRAASP